MRFACVAATAVLCLASSFAARGDQLKLTVGKADVTQAAREEVWIEVTGTLLRTAGSQDLGIPVTEPTLKLAVEGTALDGVTWNWAEPRISVLFLVDVSLSMRGDPISKARQAIGQAIPSLKGASYGVIAFGDDIDFLPEGGKFTEDPLQAQGILEKIQARAQRTQLYDAISRAAGLLKNQGKAGGRAIVVLSDGHDEGSLNQDETNIIGQVRDAGVRIHALGFATDRDRAYLPVMDRLARETGGLYREASDPTQFAGMYLTIAARLHDEQVRVKGRIPPAACEGANPKRLCDGAEHVVELRAEAEGLAATRATATLSFPDTYVAPPVVIPWWQTYRTHLVIAGGVLLVGLVLAVVLGLRASKRRKLQARTCSVCGTLKATPVESCAECARREAENASKIREEFDQKMQSARQEAQQQRTILCRLVGQEGPSKGVQFAVTEHVAVLGRDEGCTLVFPEEERSISRRHAQLYFATGEWRIKNLSGHPTTLVNGRAVDDYPLRHGDTLELGKSRFQFLAG